MGLLNSLKRAEPEPEVDETLDVRVAVLIPAVVIMKIDGEEDSELHELLHTCEQSPIFRDEPDEIAGHAGHALAIVEELGSSDAFRMIDGVLSPALRATAFAMAVRMVFADGEVADNEAEAIEVMAQLLEIPDEIGDAIVTTVKILQHAIDD